MNLLQAANEAKIYTAPRIYVAPLYVLMRFVSWHWFKVFLEQTTPISSTIWKSHILFFMRTIYKKIRLKIIQQWKELKSRFRLRSCHAWFVFHYINNVMQSITYKESLLEKYPNTEFFWSVFSRIQSKYGKIRTRKNSLFWHFSRKELEGSILCSIGLPKFKYSSFQFFSPTPQ